MRVRILDAAVCSDFIHLFRKRPKPPTLNPASLKPRFKIVENHLSGCAYTFSMLKRSPYLRSQDKGNPQGSIESEKISRQHVIDVLCDVVGAHSNLQIDTLLMYSGN